MQQVPCLFVQLNLPPVFLLILSLSGTYGIIPTNGLIFTDRYVHCMRFYGFSYVFPEILFQNFLNQHFLLLKTVLMTEKKGITNKMKKLKSLNSTKRQLIKKIIEQPILYIILLLAVVATYIFTTVDIGSLFSSLTGPTSVKSQGSCEVHYINVGQGDSTLILTDKSAVLIDAGTTESGNSVAAYVKNRTKTIDYMILTHPHEDHIGGASYVIENIEVRNIIMPDITADSASFDRLLLAIEKSNSKTIAAEKGMGFTAGGLRIEILSPPADKIYEDTNNMSIVSRITFKNSSFLFTGDAEAAVEYDLLSSGQNLRSDILKVGHHGSSTSSCEDFIKAVSPKFAIISCGKGNTYGHPHSEVTKILKKYNIQTFRTDKDGTVVLTSDGKKIYVN